MTEANHISDLESLLQDDGWLRRLAARLARPADDADDLVQETMLAAVTAPPTRPGGFQAWVRSVLCHIAGHRGRRERERPRRELAAARERAAVHPHELAQQVRLRRIVADAMLDLREPWQSAVLLRFYAGMTSVEIGRKLGVPDGTVRSWIHEAVLELRQTVGRETGVPPERLGNALLTLLLPVGASSALASGGGGASTAIASGGAVVGVKVKFAIVTIAVIGLGGGAWDVFQPQTVPPETVPVAADDPAPLPSPARSPEDSPRRIHPQPSRDVARVVAPEAARPPDNVPAPAEPAREDLRDTIGGRLVLADGSPPSVLDRVEEILGIVGREAKRDSHNTDREIEIKPSMEEPRQDALFLAGVRQGGAKSWNPDRWRLGIGKEPPAWVSVWFRGRLLGKAALGSGPQGPDLLVDLGPIRELGPFANLVVRVRDARSGGPVEAASIRVRAPIREQETRARSQRPHDAHCDRASGDARLYGLESGEWIVDVHAQKFGLWTSRVIVKRGETVTVDAALAPADSKLVGRVRDQFGNPVVDARIKLADCMSTLADWEWRTTTDSEGLFSIQPLARRSYLVHVSAAEGRVRAAFMVESDGYEHLLVLKPSVEVTLEVPVRTKIRISLTQQDGLCVFENLESEGSYNGPTGFRLVPGRYTADVSSPGFKPARVEFDAIEGARIEVPLQRER